MCKLSELSLFDHFFVHRKALWDTSKDIGHSRRSAVNGRDVIGFEGNGPYLPWDGSGMTVFFTMTSELPLFSFGTADFLSEMPWWPPTLDLESCTAVPSPTMTCNAFEVLGNTFTLVTLSPLLDFHLFSLSSFLSLLVFFGWTSVVTLVFFGWTSVVTLVFFVRILFPVQKERRQDAFEDIFL